MREKCKEVEMPEEAWEINNDILMADEWRL